MKLKLALLATLLTFTGSIAGFQVATAGGAPDDVGQRSVSAQTDQVLVRPDADCPEAARASEV